MTFLWEENPKLLADALVMGSSLKQHTKADRICCVFEDTAKLKEHNMLSAFWQVEYVKYTALPCHLQGTEIGRLEAVFSKLQVWDRFHGRYKRRVRAQRQLRPRAAFLLKSMADA